MSLHVRHMKSSAQCLVQWLLRDILKRPKLLRVEQVPEVHREPYIYTGYRPLYQPWKYYIHSILHLHNESLNIWTHVIGFFVILYNLVNLLKDYDVLNDQLTWPIITFGVCSLLSMVLSSTAHLLHSKSAWHHYILFMLDYAAVAVYGFGIGVASMYISSSKSFRRAFHPWYLPANVLCSWFIFFAFCKVKIKLSPNDRKRKRLMMVSTLIQGVFLLAPVAPRYLECITSPGCGMAPMNHVTLVLLLDLLCAATFVAFLPERLIPGRCDIFGHSHQIFHVVAVVTIVAKISAMKTDVETLNVAGEVFPSFTTLCVSFFTLLFVDVLTYMYFVRWVNAASRKGKINKRAKVIQ